MRNSLRTLMEQMHYPVNNATPNETVRPIPKEGLQSHSNHAIFDSLNAVKHPTEVRAIDQELSVRPKTIADARERAILCARTASDNRGRDVLVLDMREVVDWVDYLVIATGSSRRQIASMSDEIEKAMGEVGDSKDGIEGYDTGLWCVLDFFDVVVHLFSPEKRDYYGLEHLWAEAVPIEWRRPGEEESTSANDDEFAHYDDFANLD